MCSHLIGKQHSISKRLRRTEEEHCQAPRTYKGHVNTNPARWPLSKDTELPGNIYPDNQWFDWWDTQISTIKHSRRSKGNVFFSQFPQNIWIKSFILSTGQQFPIIQQHFPIHHVCIYSTTLSSPCQAVYLVFTISQSSQNMWCPILVRGDKL